MAWEIIDGSLPFLEDFPQMSNISNTPSTAWKIKDGNLSYRLGFVEMPNIDDVPLSIWNIKDNNLPYRVAFPETLKITEFPCSFWGIKDGGLPYRMQFPPMPGPPTMWGSIMKLTLSQMHNSPILLKTQKSQDVQIGDTTIPHQITERLFDGIDWELI